MHKLVVALHKIKGCGNFFKSGARTHKRLEPGAAFPFFMAAQARASGALLKSAERGTTI
jgi:hypothetical protein